MRRKLLLKLAKLPFMKILAATPAPRWMVLLVDILIVAISCIITFSFNGYVPGESMFYTPLIKTAIIVTTYLLFSIIFRSYQYIVRLSAIEDVYRIAILVFTSSVILALFAFIIEVSVGTRYYSIWNLFNIGVFSFSLMM